MYNLSMVYVFNIIFYTIVLFPEPLPQPILLVQDIGSTYIQINWSMLDEIKATASGKYF